MDLRRRGPEDSYESRHVIREEPAAYKRPLKHTDGGDVDEEVLPTDLRGDRINILLLYCLYVLQGIPLGLIGAVPMLLQNHGASYKQQAEFSFANWPFSLKLLWAPIVDAVYVKRFGRRKSWMVPSQYLIGFFMLFLSQHIDDLLGGQPGQIPNLPVLTILFFLLNFLAATQDIAVDGWALTMLKPCNVGYASTANSVGQTTGYFFGYVLFMALESKEFCNNYLRSVPQPQGMVTLSSFLGFWGVVFLVVTTLVAVFKKEQNYKDDTEKPLDIASSYRVLTKMFALKPIRILALILLTVKVAFAVCDNVASLKLIEFGVPKEKLALLAVPLVPLQMLLPLYLSRYTNGPRPMDIYVRSIPYRLILANFGIVIVFLTPKLITANDGSIEIPFWYYVFLVAHYGSYQVFLYAMFVAIMAFFAKISDPAVGGTYMTFLNTLANMGGNWPAPIVLWFVEALTWQRCIHKSTQDTLTEFSCSNDENKQLCENNGGECQLFVSGFYVEAIFCTIYGIIWLTVFRKWIYYLQDLPIKAWRVSRLTKSELGTENDDDDDDYIRKTRLGKKQRSS